jgi:regulator of protease activity HflC (stomatin/prohibitin superfamily)
MASFGGETVMATNEIIKTDVVEVIPSTELFGLREALSELTREAEKLEDYRTRASALPGELPLTDAEVYATAGLLLNEVRASSELAPSKINPYKAVAKRVLDFLDTRLKAHKLCFAALDAEIAGKMAERNKRERESAEREQRRINEEKREAAQKRADEQRAADELLAKEKREKRVAEIRGLLKRGKIGKREAAKLLKEAGATQEADLARAAADAEDTAKNVDQVKVLPNKVTILGQRARAPWQWRMVDITKIPRELLYPNRNALGHWDPEKFPRIGEMVRNEKDKVKAEAAAGGGIEVYQDDRV